MTNLIGLRPDYEFESAIDRNAQIGEGTGRRVYAVENCKSAVIKESKGPFHYSNFVEWIVWTALHEMGEEIMGNEKNEDLKHRFAACLSISHSARFLMMERLEELDVTDTIPMQTFPMWLNDKKSNAFGKTAEGQVKVMDYGMINFYQVLNPKNHTSL